MSGGLAGSISQAAANTAFLAKGDEIFNRPKESTYGIFTDTVQCDGEFLELDTVGPPPAIEEIVGSRLFSALRLYARRDRVKRWGPKAIEISRLKVEQNKNGSITKRLTDYLGTGNFMESPVWAALMGNPVGIDGVALLHDSHPHGNAGATWDNKVTDALTPDTFNTGIAAMASLRFETGVPAGFYPTHLFVGPDLEKMARDLCENPLRPFPMAATGLEAYASAVAATAIPNQFAGRIQAVVSPYFIDGTNEDSWLLMDLSKPGVRPIVVGEALAPMAVAVTDPQAECMVYRSSYQYYAEAQASIGGFCPYGIYGKLG